MHSHTHAIYDFKPLFVDDVCLVDGFEWFADGFAQIVDGPERMVHQHTSSTDDLERIVDGFEPLVDCYAFSVDGVEQFVDGFSASMDGIEHISDRLGCTFNPYPSNTYIIPWLYLERKHQ